MCFFYSDVLEEHVSHVGASFFLLFSLIFELLERSRRSRDLRGDLYFQKWAPRLDGSTILETWTSKNGKRVTEGAYAFAWDEERAGERVREDETRSQITK